MESIWEEYLKKINNLDSYIKKLIEIEQMIGGDYKESLSLKVQDLCKILSKKLYDYNLIIITIYGIFEGFIEQIIKEYLVNLSTYIKDYEDLPEIIRENHIELSADLLKSCTKYAKFSHLSQEVIIGNLNSCISGEPNYIINVDAFTNHSSNFRKDAIRESFRGIGIFNIIQGICNDKQFRQYFIDYGEADEFDLKHYTEDSYFTILKDIVERRNYIAHGNDVDDILSLPILENYVIYIRYMMEAIYNIVLKQLINIHFENGKKVFLGFPQEVYNNSIIGIESQYNKVFVGMHVFAQNPVTNEVRIGRILSIEVDRNRVTEISECDNILIGIKVDFYVKNNYKFGILQYD